MDGVRQAQARMDEPDSGMAEGLMAGNDLDGIPQLSARETHQMLVEHAGEPGPALIDVREVWEFQQGRAAGAVNIPMSEFRARFGEVPRDRDVLFICHSGQRSQVAARFVRQQGVLRVYNVDGGTEAWELARLPMER